VPLLTSSSLRAGARCMRAFEAVPAKAVNAAERIDRPSIRCSGWAKGAPGRHWPQPANQVPGPVSKSSRVSVRLHAGHPGPSMRPLVALVWMERGIVDAFRTLLSTPLTAPIWP
jgi:hypothetical protein